MFFNLFDWIILLEMVKFFYLKNNGKISIIWGIIIEVKEK